MALEAYIVQLAVQHAWIIFGGLLPAFILGWQFAKWIKGEK